MYTSILLKENETIIDQWKSGQTGNVVQLKNKPPTYNEGYFTIN